MSIHHGKLDLTGVDPEAVLEAMMSTLTKEDRQDVFRLTHQEMERKSEAAAAATTREGLIENFFKARTQIQSMLFDTEPGTSTFLISTTQANNVKPAKRKVLPLKDCCPLTIRSMTLNTTPWTAGRRRIRQGHRAAQGTVQAREWQVCCPDPH